MDQGVLGSQELCELERVSVGFVGVKLKNEASCALGCGFSAFQGPYRLSSTNALAAIKLVEMVFKLQGWHVVFLYRIFCSFIKEPPKWLTATT